MPDPLLVDVVVIGGGLAGMTAAADRSRGARVCLMDRTVPGLVTNTTLPCASARERRLCFDLASMARVLQVILAASLARRESRGCFLRSGHPDQDDAKWLKNSRVSSSADKAPLVVDHRPAGNSSDGH
jgi:succinate dehydrogenase/fumarate reductase flavoprotein subunit